MREPLAVQVAYLADCPDVLPQVADWLHAQFWSAAGAAADKAAAHLGRRANRDQLPLTLVALADGLPVGTVSLTEDRSPDGRERLPCVAGVYVVPAWRGRGVGRLLCGRAVEEAARLGLPRLHLFTTDQEAFFAHLGWEKQADTLVRVGRNFALVAWMERTVV